MKRYFFAVFALFSAIGASSQVLDTIIFGNASSESAHNLVTKSSSVNSTSSGRLFRTVADGGFIGFEIACAPLLTAEFVGEDDFFEGELVSVIKEVFGGSVSDCSYPPELNLCLTDRLDHRCLGGVAPGRSQAVTFALGKVGECSGRMNLTLESNGAPRSNAMYRVFSHSDWALFDPSDSVIPKGFVPAPAKPRSNGSTDAGTFLEGQVKAAGDWMSSFQGFGDGWEEAVAQGSAPASMSGAVFSGGWNGLVGVNQSVWEKEWSSRSCASNNNWFRGLEMFARVGNVSRVIAGLDFLRRAQGANGGYDDRVHGNYWIGGPNRINASGVLEGYGHMALGASFVRVLGSTPPQNMSRILAQKIDDDNDPATPNVTRRSAYEDLFANSRDYLLTHHGHAPNQDIADMLAATLSNEALIALNSSKSLPKSALVPDVRNAVGLGPSPLYPQTPWISAEGISMEPNGRLNGGFSAGYGDLAWMTDRLAELYNGTSVDIAQRAVNITRALGYLRFLDNCQDVGEADGVVVEYRCLRLESIITWRHNKNPSQVSFGGGSNFYGALVAQDPIAQRLVQLRLELGDVFSLHLDSADDAASPHFPDRAADAAAYLEAWPKLQNVTTTEKLPWEDDMPDFIFTDTMAGLVIIRRGTNRLFIALQWRHGFNTSDPSNRIIDNVVLNNIARVHYSTPTMDRIANVPMQTLSPNHNFSEIWALDYGPFLVAMHTATPEDQKPPLQYVISPQFVGLPACNLVTNSTIPALHPTYTLAPQESFVVLANTTACN